MFDETKFCIGSLCKKHHVFEGSEGSLRYKSTNQCVECHKEWTKSYSRLESTKESNRQQAKRDYWKNRDKKLSQQAEYRKTESFKQSVEKSRKKHQDKHRKYTQEWRRDNKEHISRYNAQYALEHKETIKEKAARRRKSNKELISKRRKLYYKNNIEEIKKQQKKYRQTDHGRLKRRLAQIKREALKSGNGHIPYTLDELLSRFALLGNCCVYCRDTASLTIDHFIALAAGGVDALYNIVPACPSCNNRKGKKPVDVWYAEQSFFDADQLVSLHSYCKQ